MGFNKITNGWFAAGVLDQRWTSNIAEVDITTALGRRLVVDFWWTLKIRSPGAGIFRWRGGRSLHYPRGQPGLRWELALFGRLLLPLKRWHSCFRLCRSWADWGMDTINPSQEFIELLRKSWEISVQRGPFSREFTGIHLQTFPTCQWTSGFLVSYPIQFALIYSRNRQSSMCKIMQHHLHMSFF